MSDTDSFAKILAVGVVVLDESGNILLRQRTKEPDQGTWEYIAGYIEPGERLVDAVKRKLQEKVGISKTDSIEFTGKYYDEPNRHPGNYCIPFIFIARVKSADVTVSSDAKWFSPTEIADVPMALDNKKVVQDVLAI